MHDNVKVYYCYNDGKCSRSFSIFRSFKRYRYKFNDDTLFNSQLLNSEINDNNLNSPATLDASENLSNDNSSALNAIEIVTDSQATINNSIECSQNISNKDSSTVDISQIVTNFQSTANNLIESDIEITDYIHKFKNILPNALSNDLPSLERQYLTFLSKLYSFSGISRTKINEIINLFSDLLKSSLVTLQNNIVTQLQLENSFSNFSSIRSLFDDFFRL